jgi:hypothetical protein
MLRSVHAARPARPGSRLPLRRAERHDVALAAVELAALGLNGAGLADTAALRGFNLPIAQPQETEHHESMLTTVIAIYGAALSTVSALLGAWYFLRSGPRLQAEAWLYGDYEQLKDDTVIILRVWNTGRGEITVDIVDATTHEGKDKFATAFYGNDWAEGPKTPIRLPGHSSEEWWFELSSVTDNLHPSVSTTLSLTLRVGGNRHVDVPIMDGMPGRTKRPLVLKPSSSQPELVANALVGLATALLLIIATMV